MRSLKNVETALSRRRNVRPLHNPPVCRGRHVGRLFRRRALYPVDQAVQLRIVDVAEVLSIDWLNRVAVDEKRKLAGCGTS
jgi:hypothetical protein